MEIALSDGETTRRYAAALRPESVTTGVGTVLLTVPVDTVARDHAAGAPPTRPLRATVSMSVDEFLLAIEHAPPWALAALRQRLRDRY